MSFLKNPLILLSIIVVCLLIFYAANSLSFFGRTIQKFWPCEQDPTVSFPCYGSYDIIAMILSVLIIIVVVIILFINFTNK